MDVEYLIVDHFSLKDIIRLFSGIRIDPAIQWNGTPCWIWRSSFQNSEYGRIGWGYKHSEMTHRLVYAWLVSPIPRRVTGRKTPQLDHLCRNKICCNPIHLELVPPRVNSVERGTGLAAKHAAKTHCSKGHEFTTQNTIWDTSSHRSCRICRQEKAKRQREAPNYKEKQKIYETRYFAKLGQEKRRERWRATYYRLKERKSRNSNSGREYLPS